MFAKMKEKATAAALAAADGAQKLAADTKERIDTASAGKKMLDEGGEAMKQKLLAKNASQNAAQTDQVFLALYGTATSNYKKANIKMLEAGGLPGGEAQMFNDLGAAYARRSAELEKGAGQLKTQPGMTATISKAESDAILMLTSKMKAMGLHTKISRSMSSVGGASNAPISSLPSADPEVCADPAAVSNDVTVDEPTAGPDGQAQQGWMDKAKSAAMDTHSRGKERFGNAKSGKKMVDEGDQDTMTRLLAKKASIDSVAADTKAISQLQMAIEAYKEAEGMLKEALPQDQGNEEPSFQSLADFCRLRGGELEALRESLAPIPEAISTPEAERDAILYLTTQMELKRASSSASAAAADMQGKMVEKGMGAAASSATGGYVTEVPEGTGKAAVQYAKDNPEQAKAAMAFAADTAAASKKKKKCAGPVGPDSDDSNDSNDS